MRTHVSTVPTRAVPGAAVRWREAEVAAAAAERLLPCPSAWARGA